MSAGWKLAAAGGLGGAALAFVLVLGAAQMGLLPASSASIHDYLMTHPDILVDMTNKLQFDQEMQASDERQAAVDRLGPKPFFNPKLAFITGPANAKTTVVEFFDYNCPYCRASVPAVKKFYDAHKNDTRFAFIEYPIDGPDSTLAARAALAARKQPNKYVAFHFLMMSSKYVMNDDLLAEMAKQAGLDGAKLKADMADPAIDLALASSRTLGAAAKLSGTPAFIIDGKIREGTLDDKTLKRMTKT
ncbi:MAG TPA: thioredoxin domain-containing protein [Rhizomicrobium sp.]|jgi:protein-disulfide isomerase|nr:thioredoxin domain-containing protein [Rhizomicrobium sp.]